MASLKPLIAVLGMASSASAATILENWQFNDAANTTLNSITNSAGTANWGGTDTEAVTNGSGQLVFTQGTSGTDNVFRNAAISSTILGNELLELSWLYSGADFSGGDNAGSSLGFGLRDSGTTDLFLVRLQEQGGEYRLQARVAGTNNDLITFANSTAALAGPLGVRVLANLTTDKFDVFWTFNGGSEQSSLGLAFDPAAGEFAQLRMAASSNNVDFGATDFVSVDYFTLTAVPEPSRTSALVLSLAGLFFRRRRC